MCTIWESCKHQATSYCENCYNNTDNEEDKDYYEFNNWDKEENDW